MAAQRVQLFTPAGKLVVTATVDAVDGRWPDAVKYAGERYVLREGRYVLVAAEATATPVGRTETRADA